MVHEAAQHLSAKIYISQCLTENDAAKALGTNQVRIRHARLRRELPALLIKTEGGHTMVALYHRADLKLWARWKNLTAPGSSK